MSLEGYKEEFLNDLPPAMAEQVPPDLWMLHWRLTIPQRRGIAVGLMEALRDNFTWFPRYQAFLREHRPPTLICRGPHDGYMPEKSARAWLRDLPDAQLHLLDGGHWLLEMHLEQVVPLMREFLGRAVRAR